MRRKLAAISMAGLMLAQMNSYNGGIPITPGTSVPESNPATAIPAPQSAAPSASFASPTSPVPDAAPSGNSGPAYSFGAAPAPLVSPGR